MKKNVKFLAYIGLLTFMLVNVTSCQKDFLSKKPLNAYSEADVWTNLNLVQTFVNSKYRSLPKSYGSARVVPSASALSASSDEGFCQWNYESVWFFNLGTISPDNVGMDAWKGYYTYIRDCNTFFAHIATVPGDAAMKTRLTGEMRFIRAWCYFDLISRFGGVPLITKVYGLTDADYLVKRNTYDECMAFITKELDQAATELPTTYSGGDIGRITKGAALSLKSRSLLYAASAFNNPTNDQTKWAAAEAAAKAVVDLGVYSLYQGDYKQIFLAKFNSEVILSFDINATKNPSGNFESKLNVMIGPNGYHGYSAYTPGQFMVDSFPMSNGKMIGDAGSGYDANNPYLNRDPRFYADILYNGTPFRGRAYETFVGGLDSPQSSVEQWNASLTGYNWRKYADESEPVDENLGSDQNWIIFRYAEILLNYAESAYQVGDENTARKYLNMIRSRPSVLMPPVTATGNDLFKAIQSERQIELCFEGHRYFDVRRWKIAMQTDNQPLMGVKIDKDGSGNLAYSYFVLQVRKFAEQNYLNPIPKYETDKNKNLVQNPKY